MLKIKDVTVKANSSIILDSISLQVEIGDTLILFGPNGSGKSTLIKAAMGIQGYEVTRGSILLDGVDITKKSISERAKMGIGMMFQYPPRIHGVKLLQIAEYLEKDKARIDSLAEELNVKQFLARDLNVDLSGGEMKRAELFQLLLQKPRFLLLDEPESGVDIENVAIMGKVLNRYLKGNDCGCLIITHTGYILQYVEGRRGCVMVEGKMYCQDNPEKIFHEIEKYGYDKCKECEWRKR